VATRGPHASHVTIANTWFALNERIRTASPDAKLAIAEQLHAVMTGFAALAPHHRAMLAEAERTFTFAAEGNAARAAAEEAWAAHPALAEYRAEQLAAQAAHGAEMVAVAEAQRAQAELDAPMTLLTVLRTRGLHFDLSVDRKHITLLPGEAAKLTPNEAEALKHCRAEILAILQAEAEAARPVVVA